jgi:hypothetical protein
MGGLVRYLRLKAQAQVGLSPGVLIFGTLAVLCAATTLILLVFAAFIWLTERYTPLTAALVLFGFFLLLTILAGIGSLVSRHTTIARAQREMRARGASPLYDPKMLGVGLQLARSVGWRRMVPLVAIAVIAAGVAREWFTNDAPAADEPGEDDDPAA